MNNLPYELQNYIMNFVPKEKKRAYYISNKTTYDSSILSCKQLVLNAQYKICLYLIMRHQIKKLFNDIQSTLNQYSLFLFNYQYDKIYFNNQCLCYSPINQRTYMCRFCNSGRNTHKYIKMMNIYNNLSQ